MAQYVLSTSCYYIGIPALGTPCQKEEICREETLSLVLILTQVRWQDVEGFLWSALLPQGRVCQVSTAPPSLCLQ